MLIRFSYLLRLSFSLFQVGTDEGTDQGNDRENQEDPGDWGDEEDRVAAFAHEERSAEVRFSHRTEDETQDRRRNGCIRFLKEVAEDSEEEHHTDIKEARVDRVRANNTEHEDHRSEDRLGNREDLHKEP